MKRILSLALMALLVCLPVWAMAANTYDLSTYTPNPDNDNDIYLFDNYDAFLADGDTITGTAKPCRIIQMGDGVENNTTLYFKNVYVEDGSMSLSVKDYGNVKLVLQGNNYIASQDSQGLYVFGKLIIESIGNLGADIISAKEGCDMVLPNYSGPVPDGQQFIGWIIRGDGTVEQAEAGKRIERTGSTYIEPDFVIVDVAPDIAEPEMNNLPQTGDESNVILWSALAFISVIGMTMLVRKRKEA